MRARGAAAVVLAAALCALTAPTPAPAAPYGSGVFGAWRTGPAGLPAYRYTLDEERDARARQPELAGSTDAWHQVGNDHVVANAYNHGEVQLWSQDRRFQWVNRRDGATGTSAAATATCGQAAARSAPATTTGRRARGPCATSASARSTGGCARPALDVDEVVYAPFGDDPLLLHDVTIANTSRRTRRGSWFEFWDVNPYDQQTKQPRGLEVPRWDRAAGR